MEYRLVTTANERGVFNPQNAEAQYTEISEQVAYSLIQSRVPGVGLHYFISVVKDDGNIEDVTSSHVWSWEQDQSLTVQGGERITPGDDCWTWRNFIVEPSSFYVDGFDVINRITGDLDVEGLAWEQVQEFFAGYLLEAVPYGC